MKRVLPAIVLIGILFFPAAVFGATVIEECDVTHKLGTIDGVNYTGNETGVTDPIACTVELILKIGDWIFAVILAVATIFFIFGAFQFITAAGSPEKVHAARDKLIYAAVGVALAFLARGLVAIIQNLIIA